MPNFSKAETLWAMLQYCMQVHIFQIPHSDVAETIEPSLEHAFHGGIETLFGRSMGASRLLVGHALCG